MNYTTKDSGKKIKFKTGAVRNSQTEKLRYDLIPTHALKRIAGLYMRGASIYGERNWEKGLTFSNLVASLERHLNQFKQGDKDEDHLAACAWNVLALLHFQEVGREEELNDLPKYK